MLKRRTFPARLARIRQQGMVLLVALVVLVAITIVGIALIRSVDTATLVTGNLAFQQAATHATDKGVEAALAMLRQKAADNTLDTSDPSNGYSATFHSNSDDPNPTLGQSWQDFWQANLASSAYDAGTDQFGNHIYFVVNRMCALAVAPGAGGLCVESPAILKASGNGQGSNQIQINGASQVYYRITVRVSGPKRTESYVQSHIAM